MIKVYIDGQAGTTGLALEARLLELAKTTAIQWLTISDALRKDVTARKKLMNQADVVFLCLPDEAAKEAVALIDNPEVVIIDASTAHRTNAAWVYGFPELSADQHAKLTVANKIAVPGCHATGFIALVYPLIQKGLIQKSDMLYCHSLTGYSGGGKQMIADYEADQRHPSAAWMYALDLKHKHLPEMKQMTGLETTPLFVPVVVPVNKGMIVSLPLKGRPHQLHAELTAYYAHSSTVKVMDLGVQTSLHIENELAPDALEIYVFGQGEQAVIAARLDNLGKGSSGAAVQCMKVRFGLWNG
ncbi:MAG: N-acetyl-gamma-glutamyl-phosphate reductase [Defluviitaleaceae bacterium]|nr:N-acetyl-gamma-glutamyl-phosphate reductase [Defluviitaleaceae bacterium]